MLLPACGFASCLCISSGFLGAGSARPRPRALLHPGPDKMGQVDLKSSDRPSKHRQRPNLAPLGRVRRTMESFVPRLLNRAQVVEQFPKQTGQQGAATPGQS